MLLHVLTMARQMECATRGCSPVLPEEPASSGWIVCDAAALGAAAATPAPPLTTSTLFAASARVCRGASVGTWPLLCSGVESPELELDLRSEP